MHSKQLGNLGETIVAASLIKKGYSVFTQLGDLSKIDLLAVGSDFNPIKIQIKCIHSKKWSNFYQDRKGRTSLSCQRSLY